MAIKVICDKCGREISAKAEYAGRVVLCPQCGESVEIPKPRAVPPPPPVARPIPPSPPPHAIADADLLPTLERMAVSLEAIQSHAKQTEKFSKATAQYTGCLVLVFVVLPVLAWALFGALLAS